MHPFKVPFSSVMDISVTTNLFYLNEEKREKEENLTRGEVLFLLLQCDGSIY